MLRYAIAPAINDSKLFAVEEFSGRIYTNGNSSADYAKNSYEVIVILSIIRFRGQLQFQLFNGN